MATLSAQLMTVNGLEPSYAAAAGGGDKFLNTAKEYVHVKNDSVADVDVTFVTTKTVDGLAVADKVVTVPAGEERIIGPFPKGTYNDGDGFVNITYESVTTVTVAVLKAA